MAISFNYESYLLGIIPYLEGLRQVNTHGYSCTPEQWVEYFDYAEENLSEDRFNVAFISNVLHDVTSWWMQNYFLETIFTKDLTTELYIENWNATVCQYRTPDGMKIINIRNDSGSVQCYFVSMDLGAYLFTLKPISGTDEAYGLFDDIE